MKTILLCCLLLVHCALGYNTTFCDGEDVKYLDYPIGYDSEPREYWDLSGCNIVGLAGRPFDKNITRLNLSFNYIGFITAEPLKPLKQLKELDLSNNSLRYIEKSALRSLRELYRLNLSNNLLKFDTLRQLLRHSVFGLFSASNANTIPNYVLNHTFGLKNVWYLFVANNSISSLSRGVFDSLTDLNQLDISGNLLTELPENVFHNQKELFLLFLSKNRLKVLRPDVFEKNIKLNYLSINNNDLSSLPNGILKNLPQLKHFEVSGNKINHLQGDLFKSNVNLAVLDISNNNLSSIEEKTFSNLPKLSWVSIGGNNLEFLPETLFANSPLLELLLLNKNKIEHLNSTTFHGNPNLRMLDLSHNRITRIEASTFGQHHLTGLFLNGNKIREFPASMVIHMKKLVCLDLGNNELSRLSHEFAQLSRLVYFSIYDNLITRLPDLLFARSTELNIDIGRNPLKCSCLNSQLAMAEYSGVRVKREYFSDGKSVTCIMTAKCDDSPYDQEYFEWEEVVGAPKNVGLYERCAKYFFFERFD